MDRAPMSTNRDDIRELALRRKVAGNVLVISGHCTQFFAGTFVWIEYDDRLPRVFLEIIERCNEISISGDKYDAVKTRFHVIDEHLRGNVHV